MKRLYREGRIIPHLKNKNMPIETRLKISKTRKIESRTPENRAKTSKFFKKFWKEHPKKLKQVMDKTINLWKKDKKKREEINRKISIQGRMRFKKPEEKLRMRKAVKQYWKNHPNLGDLWRLKMLLYYAFHRKARNRLLENSKNPFKVYIKTKQGFKVRSNGEKITANALYKLKEPAEYEKQPLFFPEDSCIPDFWLPKAKKIIEFYGGYPKAWKKKVLKNRLYKKYKIPVILITPAELLNIEEILKREIRKKNGKEFDIKKWQNPLVMADKEEMKLVLKMFPKFSKETFKFSGTKA